MPEQDRWQLELSEYIRQGEPERAEKSAAWQTAIGLQAVDGLKTSSYLLQTAKVVGTSESPVLSRIIRQTNVLSDNFYAEAIFRQIPARCPPARPTPTWPS